MSSGDLPPPPERFARLKKEIATTYLDFEAKATKSWGEIIAELGGAVASIEGKGSNCIPQVKFQDLETLDAETVARIKRVGTVVIRDIVDDEEAAKWKDDLKQFAKDNPEVDGVDLSVPLTYADRFRIRKPGQAWGFHPPHIDGNTIHTTLQDALGARTSLYGRPSQSTVFRTFQGWLAMSETAPGEGTLQVFPDVLLSNAYIILRPFFRPRTPAASSSDALNDPKNWEFDVTDPLFHGIRPRDGGIPRPNATPELHPHLQLEKTMISIPKVYPGDAVLLALMDHNGTGDSAVMYIPAVPKTPMNLAYVARQKECFLQGRTAPRTFPKARAKRVKRIYISPAGRVAIGFA
ncbi:hypothetical protein FA13DRAFT_1916723 [Coprinellus micaceus]|uniref:Clavaminate synthase-like protein n=1 Tax=Coprinellus micaceus TaxID=71717 RepID=A0A4Y7SN32_COPMI|nr:hypothetical protein FA13DRAFT_1916723 [Coprinellus micaceus]